MPFKRRLSASACALLLCAWAVAGGAPSVAHAGLLAEGQVIRAVPFTLRDGHKPMVAARVGAVSGVLMLDNGTPFPLMLNRDALALAPGQVVGRGSAASGQAVEVQTHPAPEMAIDAQRLPTTDAVRSGNFGFAQGGLGADFLGFIGSAMLQDQAWVLDHARGHWVLIRLTPDGHLAIAPPAAADVKLQVPFFIWPGEQPTLAATLGSVPLLVDVDTGDEGTLYLSADTQRRLERQRWLRPQGADWRLAGMRIGGVDFGPLTVRLVAAGGPHDHRRAGRGDQLRLGARFLAEHPCLWNFRAQTLTFLKPGSAFLAGLARWPSAPP